MLKRLINWTWYLTTVLLLVVSYGALRDGRDLFFTQLVTFVVVGWLARWADTVSRQLQRVNLELLRLGHLLATAVQQDERPLPADLVLAVRYFTEDLAAEVLFEKERRS